MVGLIKKSIKKIPNKYLLGTDTLQQPQTNDSWVIVVTISVKLIYFVFGTI